MEFVRDQRFSDVHILINSEVNGSGGERIMLQFIGQNKFSKLTDTLNFSTNPNMTDDDKRRLELRYIELGLIRFFGVLMIFLGGLIQAKKMFRQYYLNLEITG